MLAKSRALAVFAVAAALFVSIAPAQADDNARFGGPRGLQPEIQTASAADRVLSARSTQSIAAASLGRTRSAAFDAPLNMRGIAEARAAGRIDGIVYLFGPGLTAEEVMGDGSDLGSASAD